jgi:hypothetical protein
MVYTPALETVPGHDLLGSCRMAGSRVCRLAGPAVSPCMRCIETHESASGYRREMGGARVAAQRVPANEAGCAVPRSELSQGVADPGPIQTGLANGGHQQLHGVVRLFSSGGPIPHHPPFQGQNHPTECRTTSIAAHFPVSRCAPIQRQRVWLTPQSIRAGTPSLVVQTAVALVQ